MKRLLSNLYLFAGLTFLAWFTLAQVVFAFRHPWATQTERLIHVFDALTFSTVPYREMRNR